MDVFKIFTVCQRDIQITTGIQDEMVSTRQRNLEICCRKMSDQELYKE